MRTSDKYADLAESALKKAGGADLIVEGRALRECGLVWATLALAAATKEARR
jgi:hypothetical protein